MPGSWSLTVCKQRADTQSLPSSEMNRLQVKDMEEVLEDLHDKVDELEEEVKTNASTRASLRVGQPPTWIAATAHMSFCGLWCAGLVLPWPLAAHTCIAPS